MGVQFVIDNRYMKNVDAKGVFLAKTLLMSKFMNKRN